MSFCVAKILGNDKCYCAECLSHRGEKPSSLTEELSRYQFYFNHPMGASLALRLQLAKEFAYISESIFNKIKWVLNIDLAGRSSIEEFESIEPETHTNDPIPKTHIRVRSKVAGDSVNHGNVMPVGQNVLIDGWVYYILGCSYNTPLKVGDSVTFEAVKLFELKS